MNYYLDLFSPETATAFEKSDKSISGFRISRKAYVDNQKIGPGDRLICYVTRLQRFIGILEIKSKYFKDDKQIFTNKNDPFVLRFKVEPIVWLPLEKSIPIHLESIWNILSFTKDVNPNSNKWTYMVFSSPRLWPKEDCIFLEKILLEQAQKQIEYPFSEGDQKKLKVQKIRISYKRKVTASVPDEAKVIEPKIATHISSHEEAEYYLLKIGELLEYSTYTVDSSKMYNDTKLGEFATLKDLPDFTGYKDKTSAREIDVIWFDDLGYPTFCFEVEHTTDIVKGLNRLYQLQQFHVTFVIVAPEEKRSKFEVEMAKSPYRKLKDIYKFISYDELLALYEAVQNFRKLKDKLL